MTTIHSLEVVEQTLRDIVAGFTLGDWNTNSTVLSRIRGLTVKPREPPVQRASNIPIKISTNSLKTLLELPSDGQPHLNQTVPVLETLKDEESVASYSQTHGLRPRAIAVARAVICSLSRPKDIYADVWRGCSDFYASSGTTAARLLSAEDSIGEEADVNSARYRINALIFAFYFRALCDKFEREELKSKKTETIVVESLIEETGKSRDHVQTLLKRGRWYAQWIDRLGVGAIMLLGRSLASSTNVTDLDHLVEVSKAIPGFCERSQNLLEPSRRAVIEAFIRSGQPLPLEAQRYIHNLGEIANGPGQRCIEYPGPAETSAGERTGAFEAERLCRDEATGLQALVVAADQIESYTPEHASIAAQRRPTQDAQAQQQTRARDESPIAEQVSGLPPSEARLVSAATAAQQAPWQMHTNERSPATSGAPAGAHVPFAAAGQVQAHEPGSTSGNSQHGLAIGTQAQAQSHPGTWNEGMVAGQPLQPTPYHGPRSLNETSSNVPSQAGVSSFTLGITATAAASPWRSDQQLAQPSLPPLNSYTGLGLIGARNGDFPNADVYTRTLHENALTGTQAQPQIVDERDTQNHWRPYNDQISVPQTVNLGLPYNGSQIPKEGHLTFERQSARMLVAEGVALPVEHHNDETGTEIWDDFILDDFAGSLYCPQ